MSCRRNRRVFGIALVSSFLLCSSATSNRNKLRHNGTDAAGDAVTSTLLSQQQQQQQQLKDVQLGQTQDQRSLIIGGETAAIGDYPYFAHFDPPQCGGSLIAPNLLLTAGHVSSANSMRKRRRRVHHFFC
jgi:Trypsin